MKRYKVIKRIERQNDISGEFAFGPLEVGKIIQENYLSQGTIRELIASKHLIEIKEIQQPQTDLPLDITAPPIIEEQDVVNIEKKVTQKQEKQKPYMTLKIKKDNKLVEWMALWENTSKTGKKYLRGKNDKYELLSFDYNKIKKD